MFEVGDYVKVIDTGFSYSAYQEWGDKYLNFFSSMTPTRGSICEIIAKAPHSKRNGQIIYGIRDENGYEHIMGMDGIKLVKKKNYAEDFFGDLFQI